VLGITTRLCIVLYGGAAQAQLSKPSKRPLAVLALPTHILHLEEQPRRETSLAIWGRMEGVRPSPLHLQRPGSLSPPGIWVVVLS
jgi:hypothetical protein